MQPITSPSQFQFLQYVSPRLTWQTIGTSGFPNSRNIYVDTSGDDTTGNGSNLFPFLTLSKAIAIANAGNTSDSDPVAIYMSAGVFFEVNPITITVSGINIIGSVGTWIAPSDPTQNLLVMNNGTISLTTCLFQCIPSTSTSNCFELSGAFSLFVTDCSFRFFQTALLCNGTNTTLAASIVNDCIFVGNETGFSCSGGSILVGNCQMIGNTSGTPANVGFSLTSDNSILFAASSSFLTIETGILCASNSKCYLGALNFTNATNAIQVTTQGQISAIACNFVLLDVGFTAISVDGPSSQIKLNACTIDGLSQSNTQEGTGVSVTNQANVIIQSGSITNCNIGLIIGLNSDTSSTSCSCTNSQFLDNITSIQLNGSCSLSAILVYIDDVTTLSFNDVTNIQLVYSDPAIGLNVGNLTNTASVPILGIATKLVNPPSIVYNPNVYSEETLLF